MPVENKIPSRKIRFFKLEKHHDTLSDPDKPYRKVLPIVVRQVLIDEKQHEMAGTADKAAAIILYREICVPAGKEERS
ncbi:MAG: hypothetical protein K9G39_03755 [Chlorobium sp.]|uniref:hypothetical protein n=1 Tax=Chlorobium sp. TaxID=1095 RepID=UPI0025BC21B3|nr:hypothetical protein [Chlorobium sp.]MCF8382701.1 hypothetical protein [Chlorobium sp.]